MSDLASVLEGINAAVHALADKGGLIERLSYLLAERSPTPEVSTGRRPPSSRPPWDTVTANAYMGVHTAARDLETELHTYVHGTYWRRLAGSDAHTREALRAVTVYVEHANVPEVMVRHVARVLGMLVRQAQGVPAIDTAPPPAARLRQACPYCAEPLEADLENFEVYCAGQACTDPTTGAPPRWDRLRLPFLLARLVSEA